MMLKYQVHRLTGTNQASIIISKVIGSSKATKKEIPIQESMTVNQIKTANNNASKISLLRNADDGLNFFPLDIFSVGGLIIFNFYHL